LSSILDINIHKMARTVNEAFNFFMANYVNLDSEQTRTATSSRDWLLTQIDSFPDKDDKFPRLYPEKDIYFGSFARRTKKRPLDDIDIMIALSADGAVYQEFSDRIEIYASDSSDKLKRLCFDGTKTLNSRKVINKFVSLLDKVPQYQSAGIKRNMEAATLNLVSYPWTFDLVPCFFTTKDYFGRDYYLIPDGNGHWKKTDPRIDRQRVQDINQAHDGNVLNVIRLMKYWNRRPTMPSMSSYLFENMILDFYFSQSSKASSYVDLEVPGILNYIRTAIFYVVNDPKDIQGNINHLSREEQDKISKRAYSDYLNSLEARKLEKEKDHKQSIAKWREVFGSDFPSYT
jgi:predicted nucleotidyltransferase